VSNSSKPKVLIFGASGSIGSACVNLLSKDYEVISATRDYECSTNSTLFDAVVWAQGKNLTKSFIETTEEDWDNLFEANFSFVRRQLQELLVTNRLCQPARLVFIGSVWTKIARVDKSAYIATKSALVGLTQALAVELGRDGIAVNSILPGPIDNEMTRSNLSTQQLNKLIAESPAGKLVTINQVAELVRYLISDSSQGISGQSIELDYGWARSKNV
jgi:NAD(P)-dependent dehydrogenase (short-subunit alcohol dehydrogenase family)